MAGTRGEELGGWTKSCNFLLHAMNEKTVSCPINHFLSSEIQVCEPHWFFGSPITAAIYTDTAANSVPSQFPGEGAHFFSTGPSPYREKRLQTRVAKPRGADVSELDNNLEGFQQKLRLPLPGSEPPLCPAEMQRSDRGPV